MNLKKQIADWVMAKLDDPATKEKVVSKWNKNVNIPILNESTEEKIFGAIYDSVKDVIKDVLIK
jgi:chorismate mutase|tara:strand:+ start:2889 stop:3080 length:192 start_codon:yes stop_codon:yes gene_type:complete